MKRGKTKKNKEEKNMKRRPFDLTSNCLAALVPNTAPFKLLEGKKLKVLVLWRRKKSKEFR